MATDSDENDNVLDYRETPLNACSLETFCDADSRSIPLCLGCYQLNETTGNREGRLDLYSIPFHEEDMDSLSFGANLPLTIFGDDPNNPAPGVLDGKWSNRAHNIEGSFQNYYATAHANGEIWVHDIQSSKSSFQAKLAGTSDSPSSSEGLCLALAWESPLYSDNNNNSSESLDTRIISSYSDGHAAIHRVRKRARQEGESTELELEFELEHHWYSHKMFTVPAEVWCANFIDSNTVVTGGDEGSWKLWDLRQPLLRPVHHGQDDFGAGVTVLSPHPQNSQLLAIGSYDETVAIFDLRQANSPQSLYHSESLGGGIWRCKWHPFDANKLLVAAMHGGCVVGEFQGLSTTNIEGNIEFQIQNEFKLHKSMAYGIDWLSSGKKDTAASCSFYDKAMYLWKTSPS